MSRTPFAFPVHTQLALLGAVLVIGRLLSRFHIMWMGEAGAALLLGLLVGLILHLAKAPQQFTEKLVFQVCDTHTHTHKCICTRQCSLGIQCRAHNARTGYPRACAFARACVCVLYGLQTPIFLYVMLPTIMFDAGYSLDPKP